MSENLRGDFLTHTVYNCYYSTIDMNEQLNEFVSVLFLVKLNGCMTSIMFRGVGPVHILLEFCLVSSCSVSMEN